MAKKKIEGTEEETPKTRKEIRQERRQMKNTNDYRQSLGEKEKYYSNEEIRNVGKPVESQPSTPLSGTMPGVGNSSTTYNDPNAPAPAVEVVKSSNIPEKQPQSKEEEDVKKYQNIRVLTRGKFVNEKNLSQEQTDLMNRYKDKNVPEIVPENTGEAVKKALTDNIIADKNTSFEEKMNTLPATEAAKTEVNKTEQQIKDQTNQEVKNTTTPISTTDPNAIGGSGASVVEVMDKAPAGPEWTSVVPTGQQYQAPSREEIYEQARQAKVKAPSLVVEKLGLQDYYPEAGRNIAVGTFTGSRIGSQTIYSGAGGLLPLGLYDARKRAIATEIKKKEALVDQLKEMPDIAKQFKPYFAEKYMEFLSPWMDAFKDKPEELMRNTDFIKGVRQQQAIAENFLKVNENFKSLREKLVTDDGKPAAWANERMLKILNNFNAGMLPGEIEKYFDGTKNISDLETSMREIPNAYNQADEIVKQLMDKGAIERAINMKTGKDFNPDEIKEMNSLIQQLKSASPDYETFAQLKRKYYDFAYENIAREWIEGNMPDLPKSERDAVIDSVSRYMFAQMPKASIISTITNEANGYTERRGQDMVYAAKMADIAADMEKFNKSREDHNSDTRAQVESMERTGANETFLPIANPIIAPSKTTNKEYKVWMMNPKGEWRQQYVSATEITNGNANAAKNGRSMYFSNKEGSQFDVPNDGYFGVTENGIRKQGNNYIGNQYGVMFTRGKPDPVTGEIQYTPNGVEWRKPDDVIKSSKGFNSSAEIGFNNSAGQDPKSGAKNLNAGGGRGSESSYQSSYSRGPADN
jgi:hypothetical protein